MSKRCIISPAFDTCGESVKLQCLSIESIDTVGLNESQQEINDMDFSAIKEKLKSIFLDIE